MGALRPKTRISHGHVHDKGETMAAIIDGIHTGSTRVMLNRTNNYICGLFILD